MAITTVFSFVIIVMAHFSSNTKVVESPIYRYHRLIIMDKGYETHMNHNNVNRDSFKETKGPQYLPPRLQTKKTKVITSKAIKYEDVYDLLQKIPAGKVSTYGDLAKALGNPSASRAIGRILGRNPNPVQVPCHRVVMSNGKLGGYMHGIKFKKELLKKEGITFVNETTVCNFKDIRFDHQDSKTKVKN